jgi:hypothetical protein
MTSASKRSDVDVIEAASDHVFGTWRDVFVSVWRSAATARTAVRLATVLRRFAAGHSGGVSMIVVIEPGCTMPDTEARERMSRDMKRHETFTRHMVLVYEGEGFRAAAVRSVVAGMQLLSRQVVPTTTVATVTQGASWLAERRASESLSAKELEEAVTVIRSAAVDR